MDEFGMPSDTSLDSSGGFSDLGGGTYSDFGDGSVGPGGGGELMPVQYGGFGGIAGRMIPGAPGVVAGSRGYAAGAALGRGFGYILAAGRRISVKRMWETAKRFGPEVAAAMVGYSVADLMAIFASSGVIMSGGRHRRRGISSRDIRTTKRVVGFVNRMSHDIGCVHRPHFARHRARRA
jgi:hypothetical protein